jgi:hypothetical protein
MISEPDGHAPQEALTITTLVISARSTQWARKYAGTLSLLLSSENHAVELRLERLRVLEKGEEYMFEKRRETALRSPPPLSQVPTASGSTHILVY